VRPLDLLDVEPYIPNLVALEEFEDLVRIIERRICQDSDDMEPDLILEKESNTLHHTGMRPVSLAGLAVGVVQKSRTVEAHSNPHRVRLDEVAPLLSDQRAVGLNRVVELNTLSVSVLDNRDCTFRD
jgi:hypothetical protein